MVILQIWRVDGRIIEEMESSSRCGWGEPLITGSVVGLKGSHNAGNVPCAHVTPRTPGVSGLVPANEVCGGPYMRLCVGFFASRSSTSKRNSCSHSCKPSQVPVD